MTMLLLLLIKSESNKKEYNNKKTSDHDDKVRKSEQGEAHALRELKIIIIITRHNRPLMKS